jgi:hypothetical protein
MVCNPRNNCVSGLSSLSGILNVENATFRKLDLFPSSDEGRKISSLLGALERSNPQSIGLVTEVSSF